MEIKSNITTTEEDVGSSVNTTSGGIVFGLVILLQFLAQTPTLGRSKADKRI
jgi:hypothetical protein